MNKVIEKLYKQIKEYLRVPFTTEQEEYIKLSLSQAYLMGGRDELKDRLKENEK